MKVRGKDTRITIFFYFLTKIDLDMGKEGARILSSCLKNNTRLTGLDFPGDNLHTKRNS